MPIEKCRNLLYKRGPVVLACVACFGLGSVAALVATRGSSPAPAAAAALAVRPVAFLPQLVSLPKVTAKLQVHVRAVRRKHDPKPKTPSRATISLYERTTATGVLRRQGC